MTEKKDTRAARKQRRAEYDRALRELNDVRRALGSAYLLFNAVNDPETTETCILEIGALRCRYSRALRDVRTLYGSLS